MFPNSPVFPPTASKLAPEVDALFFFMIGGAVFFTVLIVVVILAFVARYRRGHEAEVGSEMSGKATKVLEITWTVIPLALLMVSFFWGLRIFFTAARPPANAAQYYVVGKQWMWKIEHPDGKREINQLHVPIGTPVKLTMTSEDVIHNFCDQYCGVEHSKMVGQVVVQEPHEYRAWLAGDAGAGTAVKSGEELFASRACGTCHRADSSARAPILDGAFGKTVTLLDGKTVPFDETYLRESIVDPAARIVQGYQPIMPTFKGQLSEEEIIQLIKYVKGLSPGAAGTAEGTGTPGRS